MGLLEASPVEEDPGFVRKLLAHPVLQRPVLGTGPSKRRRHRPKEKPYLRWTAGHQCLVPHGTARRKRTRGAPKRLSPGQSESGCVTSSRGSLCVHDPERSQSACGKTVPGRASRASVSPGLWGKEAAWSRIICHRSDECQSCPDEGSRQVAPASISHFFLTRGSAFYRLLAKDPLAHE